MATVSNWNAYRYYQENGCQIPRPGKKSKCGRTPDADECSNCQQIVCLEHAIYLQVRIFSRSPIRYLICCVCIEGKKISDVLAQFIPTLTKDIEHDIERTIERNKRLLELEESS